MKTEQQITAARKRVLDGVAEFGQRYNLPFKATEATAEQMHFMALGSLAFADDALELERPDNLGHLLAALDRDNEHPASPLDRCEVNAGKSFDELWNEIATALPESWEFTISVYGGVEGGYSLDLIDEFGDEIEYPSNRETLEQETTDAIEFIRSRPATESTEL